MTAELAVGLPAVVLLLALLMFGATAGISQLRLEAAARAGARVLARGEPNANAEAAVREQVGNAVRVAIAAHGGSVSITVEMSVPGPLGRLMPGPLTASATARVDTPAALAAAALPQAFRRRPP
ncbi:MAG: TadE family type IV pilus minor pilin [Actinomycetales bacterium]